MSTSQMVRPSASEEKQFNKNWVTIFPNEQATYQQSLLFVKKLLAVAISNITYMRAIFPETAFGDRYLEELHLKILRDDNSCPGASRVVQWVRGCFDALDKKYLKQLILGIYTDPKNEDTLIESFSFRFSYDNNTSNMDVYRNDKQIGSARSTSETRRATVGLLRTLVILMQNLRPLPDEVLLTMKLLYYDDVTPADYEPQGFKPAKSHSFEFSVTPVNVKIGDVSTEFHSLNLRIKTDALQFKMDDDQEEKMVADELIEPTNEENDKIENFQNPVKSPELVDLTASQVDELHLTPLKSQDKMGKQPKTSKKRQYKRGPKGTELDTEEVKCGRKRARALNNENCSFELLDLSQEEKLDGGCLRRSKRRKSSTVDKPLLV